MHDVILVCCCPGVDKKAIATYKVATKKTEVPLIYKGRYGVADFIDKLRKDGVSGEIIGYSQAIAKSNEKFAYYMRWGVDGSIGVQYNLLTGRRMK